MVPEQPQPYTTPRSDQFGTDFDHGELLLYIKSIFNYQWKSDFSTKFPHSSLVQWLSWYFSWFLTQNFSILLKSKLLKVHFYLFLPFWFRQRGFFLNSILKIAIFGRFIEYKWTFSIFCDSGSWPTHHRWRQRPTLICFGLWMWDFYCHLYFIIIRSSKVCSLAKYYLTPDFQLSAKKICAVTDLAARQAARCCSL